MIDKLFLKIFNLPVALRVRFSPAFHRWKLRAKGVSVGRNCTVLGRLSVVGEGKISIGDNFYMTNGDHVNPIASNMQGAFYTERPEAVITIGNNVGMSSTRMWVHDSLTIGNHVKIGANVLLIDTDSHPLDYLTRRESNEGVKYAPIIIEDDVWIGAHCIVLKGVTIGTRSIIGAGSVVTRSIPADCVAAGNPCRVIKRIYSSYFANT